MSTSWWKKQRPRQEWLLTFALTGWKCEIDKAHQQCCAYKLRSFDNWRANIYPHLIEAASNPDLKPTMSPPMRLFRPDFRIISKNLSYLRELYSLTTDGTYTVIIKTIDDESLDETDTTALVRKCLLGMVEQPEKCLYAPSYTSVGFNRADEYSFSLVKL